MNRYEGSPAVIIERRKGTPDSPFSNMNEALVVTGDGKVLLSEIPNELNKVIVTSDDNATWYEIKDGILNEDAFKVDYINKLVTFNIVHVGKQLHFKYVGEGNHYYSPHSIYTKIEDGSVVETLGELIDGGQDALDTLDKVDTKLGEITEATNNAITATNDTKTVIAEGNQIIGTANDKITEIDGKINELDMELVEAKSTIADVKQQSAIVEDIITNGQSVIDDAQLLVDEVKSAGEFKLTTSYKKNNTVVDNGSSWIALQDTQNNPLPTLPLIENTYWRLVAVHGEKGLKGDTGASLSILGKLTDVSQLPPTGQAGNAYTINGELHVWSENTNGWENIGNFKGEKGDVTQAEMGINQYKLVTDSISQNSWKIPMTTFNPLKDTIIVVRNTTTLSPDMYDIEEKSDGFYITLKITPIKEIADNNLNIIIFKAKSIIPDTTSDGSLLTNGSVTLPKLSKKIQNSLSNADTKIVEITEQLADIETNPTFKASANTESAQLGGELIGSTGWTSIGWTGDYTSGFKNTVGQTLPLTKTLPATGTKLYQVTFRVESPTGAGVPNASTDFTVTLGNSEPFVTYQGGGNFNYTFGIRSVSDGVLSFNPGTTFNGTIKNVSVKEIAGEVEPSLHIKDAIEENVLEVRTTKSLFYNTFIGKKSGSKNTTGHGNFALGDFSLTKNTTGYWNQALGKDTLRDNTTGSRNVALGYLALEQNISGDRNIAIGTFAMERNTHGRENIAIGADALWYNTSGFYNMALGHYALGANTTGQGNVGIGRVALNQNTTGNYNVAIGVGAMERTTTIVECIAIGRDVLKNSTASQLVAIGSGALLSNTSGASNTGVGTSALRTNTTGSDNTAIGRMAGYGTSGVINRNVLVGARAGYALTTGANNNVLLGAKAGETITTGSGNIMIGYNTQPTAENSANQLNIGNLLYGVMSLSRFGIGVSAPTARMHLLASDGTGGTAPLKLQTGTLLATKEVGAIEFDGSDLYFTDNTGKRYKLLKELVA